MPADDVDLLDGLADRFVAGDRAVDIDRPELAADAARAQPRHVGHQRLVAPCRCRWRGRRRCCRNSRAAAHGRSLWPSISGVCLRMRSMRAWTLGSIGWAESGAAASSAAARSMVSHGARLYEGAARRVNAAGMDRPFVLFDDMRPGGAGARLYRAAGRGDRRPASIEEVRPALDRLAGGGRRRPACRRASSPMTPAYALEPKLRALARQGDGPLLWFGLFDGYRDARAGRAGGLLGDPAGAWTGRPAPQNRTRATISPRPREVREHLFAGDFYQANLTFGCDVAAAGPAAGRLCAAAAAGAGGLGRGGAPSRRLAAVAEPRAILHHPRPDDRSQADEGHRAARGADPAEDQAEIAELAADPKQRAENLMIVDLLRNDLARVAEPGTVEVPELFAVETFPTVHQMVSRVTARLRDGCRSGQRSGDAFPVRLDHRRAENGGDRRRCAALEPEPRGAYTGSMGWIEPERRRRRSTSSSGRSSWRKARNVARLGLGSGLVVDSVLEDEWAECLLKGEFVAPARPRLRPDRDHALRSARRRRRPRPPPRPAERAAAGPGNSSSTAMRARNELQAATFRRKEPAMVRLLLSPNGQHGDRAEAGAERPQRGPVDVVVRPLPVDPADFRLRYKTTDRRFLDEARAGRRAPSRRCSPTRRAADRGQFHQRLRRARRQAADPAAGARPAARACCAQRLIDEGKAEEADLTVDDLKRRLPDRQYGARTDEGAARLGGDRESQQAVGDGHQRRRRRGRSCGRSRDGGRRARRSASRRRAG